MRYPGLAGKLTSRKWDFTAGSSCPFSSKQIRSVIGDMAISGKESTASPAESLHDTAIANL